MNKDIFTKISNNDAIFKESKGVTIGNKIYRVLPVDKNDWAKFSTGSWARKIISPSTDDNT